MKYSYLIFFLWSWLTSCSATRSFWTYVVDNDVNKPLSKRDAGTVDKEGPMSPYNVKVVYNDGARSTEVLIPVVSSGQQIIIDHQGKKRPQALSVVPLPPVAADKDLEDSYLQQGKQLNASAGPVSIVRTHAKINELVKDGQYGLALEYAEQLLKRYPNHVKTLQTKGSLLLKLGENAAALDAYQKAQDIEFDPRVEEQIKQLEKSLGQ